MTFEELGIKTRADKVRYSALCPKCSHLRQHHKTTLCLTVNNEPDNQWYHCSHCSWSGNLGTMDRFNKVAENSRMPKQLAETYSKEVREYWDSRGIDMRIPLRHRVYEFQMARKPVLGFPTYMNETLVDVKYLDLRWKKGDDSPKWWNMKKDFGTMTLPWGIDKLNFFPDEPKVVIWTEGHIDAMTWEQAGYKNILSVPSGAPSVNAKNFEHEFDYLTNKYTQSVIADVTLHIFSTDNDAPGIKLKNHLALILGKEKCKYIQYPVGYKDINEVYKGVDKDGKKLPTLGKAGVDECYTNLSSFPIKGVIRPSDCRDDLDLIVKNGFTAGIGIGVPEIDKLFTLKPKHITFVSGIPSAGKSTFIRWYIAELIRHNSAMNLKWGLFTPENRPVAREYAKIAEVMTGQYYREGWANSMTAELRNKTMRFIEKHFFVVSPDRLNFESFGGAITAGKVNTMESILKYLIYLKKTENIFGFVIDAWNKIEHEQPRNMTETTFISQQLDYLIDFCDLYDVHGIVIVHPRKIEQQGINYKMPTLYDIKGSSAWKEKADIGIILHRNMNRKKNPADIPEGADDDDKYYVDPNTPTILRTEKIRFEELGVMDRIKLYMDPKKGGRFFPFTEKKAPEVNGKANQYKDERESIDDVFGHDELDDAKLPF